MSMLEYNCHTWRCNDTVYFPSIFCECRVIIKMPWKYHGKDLGLNTSSVM